MEIKQRLKSVLALSPYYVAHKLQRYDGAFLFGVIGHRRPGLLRTLADHDCCSWPSLAVIPRKARKSVPMGWRRMASALPNGEG